MLTHAGIIAGASGASGAPTLSITSASSVLTPTFSITFPDFIVAGDVVTLDQDVSGTFPSPVVYTHTITNADVIAGSFGFGNSALTSNTYYFRVKTRSGVDSAWSNTASITL